MNMNEVEITDLSTYRNQYESKGYFTIDNVFDEEMCMQVIRDIPSLSEPTVARYEGANGKLRRIEHIYNKSESLQNINEKLKSMLQSVFNEEMVIFKDKYNPKPPNGEGFFAHYDGIFRWTNEKGTTYDGWYKYASEFYNLLVALDPCTTENGTLEVAPIHDEPFDELLKNTKPNGTPELTKRVADDLDFSPVVLERGDVCIFSHRCPHRSDPNRSENDRRALYYTFNRISDGDNYEQYFKDKEASVADGSDKSLSEG